jgi:predicted regulator of Ras-like GTPase activity (Roadblock/LC7/MglB family)
MEKVKTVADGSLMPRSGFVSSRPSPGRTTAPSTSALPAPLDPCTVLDELVVEVDGVNGAVLASVDGFGLAKSASMADEPSHPAMLAAAVGLAHQLVAMGGGAQLRQLVVDHDGGLLLVWPIGSQRVLAVLSSPSVDQRLLRSLVKRRASVLAGATL